MSLSFSSVLVWTFLASLTFGFCSIWCLHFVAMLACELDLPIGIDVSLTILSAVLAVFFTFAALASDLLWDRSQRRKRKQQRNLRKQQKAARQASKLERINSMLPLLSPLPLLTPVDESGNRSNGVPPPTDYLDAAEREDAESLEHDDSHLSPTDRPPRSTNGDNPDVFGQQLSKFSKTVVSSIQPPRDQEPDLEPLLPDDADSSTGRSESQRRSSSDPSTSRHSSSIMGSSSSSLGLGNFLNIAYRGTAPAKNAFIATGETLYHGFTWINVVKGFCWSLAITSMHYVGIFALYIPEGYSKFNALLVVVSAAISWVVCIIGCILMPQMETHLSQQLLFTVVATSGVAAMHFTGK
jgi:NO-binding membrane sensor protein with MHYT domain